MVSWAGKKEEQTDKGGEGWTEGGLTWKGCPPMITGMTSWLCCPSLPWCSVGVCAVHALNTLLLAYCVYISSCAQSFLSIRVSSVGKCVLPCCSVSHSPLLCLHTRMCEVISLDSLGPEHELWQSLHARWGHRTSIRQSNKGM